MQKRPRGLKNPEAEFTITVTSYDVAARRALWLRRTVDAIIHSVEIGVPVALATALVVLGATPLSAVLASLACLVLLLVPYVAMGGHRAAIGRTPNLALLGIGAYTIVAVLGTTPLAAVAEPDVTTSTAGIVVLAATVALAATMSVHWLRRHRRCLAGYWLPRSSRDEIVCELVQVLGLLKKMSRSRHAARNRKAVVMEKLDRVQYLFQKGALFADVSMSTAGRPRGRRGCREIARRLRDVRDDVGDGGRRAWKAVRAELAALAAVVFTDADHEIHESSDRAHRARRERRRVRALRITKSLAVAALIMGSVPAFRAVGLPEGILATALALLTAEVVRRLVIRVLRGIHPMFGKRFTAPDLRTILRAMDRSQQGREPASQSSDGVDRPDGTAGSSGGQGGPATGS